MTPAEQAKANAISFECKKDALQQRQSGDWKISFTVQGVDMDERITRAAMGTRFVAVLVEVDENELPIAQAEKEKQTLPSPTPRPAPQAGARRDWRDMQPQQQAGIRCGEPVFIAFLKEVYPKVWREVEDAAAAVRTICDVHSRVELGTNHKARVRWHLLDEQFTAWREMERVS